MHWAQAEHLQNPMSSGPEMQQVLGALHIKERLLLRYIYQLYKKKKRGKINEERLD